MNQSWAGNLVKKGKKVIIKIYFQQRLIETETVDMSIDEQTSKRI